MGECARCGAFTDVPAEGDYQYCLDCQAEFDDVADSGVVVERTGDGYHVHARTESVDSSGGMEDSQTDALARGKYLADELGVRALFRYDETGSQWLLEEYLREHPSIRRDVVERLSRVPEEGGSGLLDRIGDALRGA